MILMCSMASELRNNDICRTDNDEARMRTCVTRPSRGVNMSNRRLFGAEMKGCHVRDWVVGESDKRS